MSNYFIFKRSPTNPKKGSKTFIDQPTIHLIASYLHPTQIPTFLSNHNIPFSTNLHYNFNPYYLHTSYPIHNEAKKPFPTNDLNTDSTSPIILSFNTSVSATLNKYYKQRHKQHYKQHHKLNIINNNILNINTITNNTLNPNLNHNHDSTIINIHTLSFLTRVIPKLTASLTTLKLHIQEPDHTIATLPILQYLNTSIIRYINIQYAPFEIYKKFKFTNPSSSENTHRQILADQHIHIRSNQPHQYDYITHFSDTPNQFIDLSFLTNTPNLETLIISHCTLLNAQYINNTNLYHLNIITCDIPQSNILINLPPQLVTILLPRNQISTKSLCEDFPHLNTVNFPRHINIRSDQLHFLNKPKYSKIKTLYIMYHELSTEMFYELYWEIHHNAKFTYHNDFSLNVPNLRKLIIGEWDDMWPPQVFKDLPNLIDDDIKSINKYCLPTISSQLKNITMRNMILTEKILSSIYQFENLESLTFNNVSFLVDISILSLNNLKSLEIDTIMTFSSIKLPSLLSLTHLKLISGDNIQFDISNYPCLIYFSFHINAFMSHRSHNIFQKMINHTNNPNLKHFIVTFKYKTTDLTINAIIFKNIPKLETIALGGNILLNPEYFRFCIHLKSITLSYFESIVNLDFLDSCEKLTTIKLYDLDSLVGFKTFKHRFHLETVCISGCSNATRLSFVDHFRSPTSILKHSRFDNGIINPVSLIGAVVLVGATNLATLVSPSSFDDSSIYINCVHLTLSNYSSKPLVLGPRLKSLEISNSYLKSLASLNLQNCPFIQSIVLKECGNLVDIDALCRCRNLDRVEIDGCLVDVVGAGCRIFGVGGCLF